MAIEKKDKKHLDKSPEFMVEQTIASMNIEGFKISKEEKNILFKIAKGGLKTDDVIDEIIKNSPINNN